MELGHGHRPNGIEVNDESFFACITSVVIFFGFGSYVFSFRFILQVRVVSAELEILCR